MPIKTIPLLAFQVPKIAAVAPELVAEVFGQVSVGADVDLTWGFEISVSAPQSYSTHRRWC